MRATEGKICDLSKATRLMRERSRTRIQASNLDIPPSCLPTSSLVQQWVLSTRYFTYYTPFSRASPTFSRLKLYANPNPFLKLPWFLHLHMTSRPCDLNSFDIHSLTPFLHPLLVPSLSLNKSAPAIQYQSGFNQGS